MNATAVLCSLELVSLSFFLTILAFEQKWLWFLSLLIDVSLLAASAFGLPKNRWIVCLGRIAVTLARASTVQSKLLDMGLITSTTAFCLAWCVRVAHAKRAQEPAIPEIVVLAHIGPPPESGLMCAICQYDMAPDATTATPKCKHVFHAQCLSEWLARRAVCPVCLIELQENP